MEWTIILLVIFWVIIPIAAKNSQKKAKAEEERKRLMRQQAPQPQRAQQPMRTAPIAPSVRPAQSMVYESMEGKGSLQGKDGPVFEGEKRHEAKSNLSAVKTTLTEKSTTITHTVTVSSESGHAHEETSASGVVQDCPPDKAPVKQTAAPIAVAPESAFVWDTEAARSGLVMAEILGPCLALRD